MSLLPRLGLQVFFGVGRAALCIFSFRLRVNHMSSDMSREVFPFRAGRVRHRHKVANLFNGIETKNHANLLPVAFFPPARLFHRLGGPEADNRGSSISLGGSRVINYAMCRRLPFLET